MKSIDWHSPIVFGVSKAKVPGQYLQPSTIAWRMEPRRGDSRATIWISGPDPAMVEDQPERVEGQLRARVIAT
jgi:hypothetical protein